MSDRPWEFWIDVGGTFTDCLACSPDGALRRLKLLSSGVTKGRVGDGPTRNEIIDTARCNDPPGFWIGWRLSIVDEHGTETDSTYVTDFDSAAGRLRLRGLSQPPPPNAVYELRSDLDAPVVAIRWLLALPLSEPVPPLALRLGTTRGTNALITRTGARTALVTTRGFGDLLEIGYQARPRLFDLAIHKPPPLTSGVIEIDERVTHDGHVLISPVESTVRQQLQALYDVGIESLAICLLHADRHPAHEQLVARIAREIGFREVSASHEVAPLPKIVARADTTVVDAYLNPVLRQYVARLRAALPSSQIRLLTSAGGLVAADQFRGKDSILSGPAGGAVGFARVAEAAGFARAIGFDMGGTSTDVSRFDGCFELEFETQKAGVRLVAPTIAIETVAAGGGSICRFDGVKLVVGPASAGAEPGPACYGRCGPLTVTDCNLYLGRLDADRFPFPLNREAAQQRLMDLAAEVAHSVGTHFEPRELAAGLLQIANANMAAAIRLVTVAKGADPADYLLIAFGSAAPQHACAVARELGIRQVLVHPDAGILSAVGIGLADVTRHRSMGVEQPLNSESLTQVGQRLNALQHEAAEEVRQEGVPIEQITTIRSLDLRYVGVESILTIAWPPDDDFASAFAEAHQKRYGYTHGDRLLEIAAARVEVVGRAATALPPSLHASSRQPNSRRTTQAYFDGHFADVPLFDRASLAAGDTIHGPVIVADKLSTTVIESGWEAEVLTVGELLLTAPKQADDTSNAPIRNPKSEIRNSSDPVFLEIFNNLLASIAEQMGVTLRNTASSVNVKERLDFSCAIFTADGRLVANAPHVPVHLGAMEETVRHVITTNPNLQPCDVFATNDPYAGGSHLPDITVVAPVHNASGERLFFTANRAHHAEIGGITPGSMPPLSKNLSEEGVLIRNLRIVAASQSHFDEMRNLLVSGAYPSRDIETNLADLAAQVAANRQGATDLIALVERYSERVVRAYMEHIQDAAEQKVRQALARLPHGRHTFTDYLETADGVSVPISVALITSPTTSPPRQSTSPAPARSSMAT